MTRIPLLSGAYQARSVIAGAQRCVNLYPESNPQDSQQPVPITHYPTPGTTLEGICPSVAIARCIYRATNGELFYVVGTTVFYVDSAFNFTALGSINNQRNIVSMSDNGLVIIIVDGSTSGWAIDMVAHTFGQITDPNFFGADKVDYLDTYLIFNLPDTAQFYISLSNSTYAMFVGGTAFDPLDIAAKTGSADPIMTLIVVHRELWLIGNLTSEIWANTGAADFTFQPIAGSFIDHGTVAKYSVAKQDVACFALLQDREGVGIIGRSNGYEFIRISTHAIEADIQAYAVLSDAIGYCYQQQGHAFYVITFPNADKSWAYELATGQWHELAWTDTNGALHRHRANCCAFAYGANLIGDWQNGRIYKLDPNVFTDDSNPIVRIRSFPHLLKDGERVTYTQFIVDMQVGTIGPHVISSFDFNNDFNDDFGPPEVLRGEPLLSLRWSDDRGVSFGNSIIQTLGDEGEYLTQVSYRRLGMARDRVFEISWSVDMKTALNGAFVEVIKHAT